MKPKTHVNLASISAKAAVPFSQTLPHDAGTQRLRSDAIDLLTKIMKIYSREMQ